MKIFLHLFFLIRFIISFQLHFFQKFNELTTVSHSFYLLLHADSLKPLILCIFVFSFILLLQHVEQILIIGNLFFFITTLNLLFTRIVWMNYLIPSFQIIYFLLLDVISMLILEPSSSPFFFSFFLLFARPLTAIETQNFYYLNILIHHFLHALLSLFSPISPP